MEYKEDWLKSEIEIDKMLDRYDFKDGDQQ